MRTQALGRETEFRNIRRRLDDCDFRCSQTPPVRKKAPVIFDSDEENGENDGDDDDVMGLPLLENRAHRNDVALETLDLIQGDGENANRLNEDTFAVDTDRYNDHEGFLEAVTKTNSVLQSMFGKMEEIIKGSLGMLTSSLVGRMDKVDR